MTLWYPVQVFIDAAPMITYPLSHIINMSIIQGCVPDELNSARVIPL